MIYNEGDEFIALLKKGDLSCYEAVFKRFYKPLVIEAYYLLKDEMEAEDLVQQFFLEAWEKQIFRLIQTAPTSYLHTAIRNRCLNLIEKRKTQQRHMAAYYRDKTFHLQDKAVKNEEISQKMFRALEKLPKQRLQAFHLVYLENKQYQEAAKEMGISINSLKTHLKLALKVLRSNLDNRS